MLPSMASLHVKEVLGGGTIIHKQVDFGYGPAQADDSVQASFDEFEQLEFDACFAMASVDFLFEVLFG